MIENLDLDASRIPWLYLPTSRFIRLPHPVLFVLQKTLIRRYRPSYKRANDAAHIYDVALLSRPIWSQMAEVLAKVEEGRMFPKQWFTRARETSARVFLRADSPGIIEIGQIYRSLMGQNAAPTEAANERVLTQFSQATGLLNR